MKYFRLIGIMSLLVFSFYLTDLVTELAINSNPLMKIIQNNSDIYNVQSVNAQIKDNTIIPGICGKKINEMESFLNMKDFGEFNKNYLVYESIKPDISLDNNREKIIVSGNKSIRQVSLLIKNNNSIMKYLNKNNIKYSNLVNDINKITDGENINIASDNKLFKDIDTIFNKKELNREICILNYSNIEECRKEKYFLVKPSIILNNNSLVSELKNISNGDIILLDENFTLENLIILLNKISNYDFKIVYLSEIIKE